MVFKSAGPRRPIASKIDKDKIKKVIEEARQGQAGREQNYRERSLNIHPWVCARCGREFTNRNLHLLTVHHKDHNHENNPPDGSNWENLCIYCHENEHRRYLDYLEGGGAEVDDGEREALTHNPFGDLKDLLKSGES
jgi:hypothetical protein